MSNNKQQTAVEWLYCNLFPKHLDGFSDREWIKIDLAFKIAKEMEREQIMDAFNNGENKSAQLYFNETFGGNK